MNKRVPFFILTLFLLILTSNCQKKSMNKSTLKINYSVIPESFHPHLVTDVRNQTICKALYEGLTRINPEGKVELAAAKKVEISPCKKRYTFTLKDSKWSNGEKLTAHHFANTWKSAISGRSRCIYAERFFLIKNARLTHNKNLSFKEVGIYVPFDNQLIVELEHPAPYFLQLVADPVYSPVYGTDLDKEPHVFNGPFVLENYNFNQKLILASNPLYWDAKTVKLEKVEISFIKNMQVAFSMYEEGQLNYLGSPFTNLPEETVKNLSDLKYQQACAPFWLFCNTKNPKLKSEKIRKALSYVVDREKIIKYILAEQKEPLYSILPKGISSLSSESPLDMESSFKLFKEGLKEIEMDQKDFHLVLRHTGACDQQKIALYLKDQWEKLFGIKISLEKSDWNSFYSKIISGDYELGGCFICNLYNDPSYFMESFEFSHSNFARWENPNYQKYFLLAKQCQNENERAHHLQKAEKILMDEMPVIPIYNHAHLYVCSDRLVNFSAPKFNYADFKWAYFRDKYE